MTDGDHLHRAILDDPYDIAARLIYSDWLEENGRDAQAELIRASIAFASSDESSVIRRLNRAALAFRWLDVYLWKECCSPVHEGVYNQPVVRPCFAHVWRGFVEGIALPYAAFLDNAKSLFSAHPIIAVQPTFDKAKPQTVAYQLLVNTSSYFPWRAAVRASDEDAPRLLSAACVEYGRHLAGLRQFAAPAASA